MAFVNGYVFLVTANASGYVCLIKFFWFLFGGLFLSAGEKRRFSISILYMQNIYMNADQLNVHF